MNSRFFFGSCSVFLGDVLYTTVNCQLAQGAVPVDGNLRKSCKNLPKELHAGVSHVDDAQLGGEGQHLTDDEDGQVQLGGVHKLEEGQHDVAAELAQGDGDGLGQRVLAEARAQRVAVRRHHQLVRVQHSVSAKQMRKLENSTRLLCDIMFVGE